MQRGRMFIILGLLLLLLLGGAFAFFSIFVQQPAETEIPPTPTPDPGFVPVAIALQPIEAGVTITRDMVFGSVPMIGVVSWSNKYPPPNRFYVEPESIPQDLIAEEGEEEAEERVMLEELIGQRARYAIQQGEPILTTSFVSNLYDASVAGSPLAEQIPPGLVGMTLPLNKLLGINLMMEPGDHINVLVAMMVVDVDEEFQSVLPNVSVPINVLDGRGIPTPYDPPVVEVPWQLVVADVGRLDNVAMAPFTIYTVPSEPQRPRLVTQQIVQDALVLAVANDTPFREPTPTPIPLPTDEGADEGEELPPTPIPPPDTITLAVTPNDSLALNYFMFTSAQFTYTLRSVGDRELQDTTSFSLLVALDRYRIEIPLPLPYSLEPTSRTLSPPLLPSDFVAEPLFLEVPDGDVICVGINCPWTIKPDYVTPSAFP